MDSTMFNFSHSSINYAPAGNDINDENCQMEMSQTQNEIVLWESYTIHLHSSQRITFLVLCCCIISFAILGNILTLYVVFTRKLRLLFKTCLLSLAVSDLLYVSSSGLTYVSRLSQKTSLLWRLGAFGCSVIPFAQVVAVSTGSMSLVAIALDRYLAVLNKSNAKLLRSKIFCFLGFFFIWALGMAISSPLLVSYDHIRIYVVPKERQEDFYESFLCIAKVDEKVNIIVFSFTFLPIFIAFVWLNTIIAKEIWKRRHVPGLQRKPKSRKRHNEDSSTLNVKATDETNTSSNGRNHSTKLSTGDSKQPVFTIQQPLSTQHQILQPNIEPRRSEHQRRHRQMRMFKVILMLMSVFIFCRLPNWIFLVYKLSHEVSERSNWLTLYCFAIPGFLNCMLNPLLYTFLSETIRVTSFIKNGFCKICKVCQRVEKKSSQQANNQTLYANNQRRKSDGGIYLGS